MEAKEEMADDVVEDLKSMDITNRKKAVYGLRRWCTLVEKAKTHVGLEFQ